jgi:hypothetical protein
MLPATLEPSGKETDFERDTMSISADAIKLLQQARVTSEEAQRSIDDLIVEHEYQDVATLVTQAAGALLDVAALLMQSQDEAALEHLETAEDLLDAVYDIIDGETDE